MRAVLQAISEELARLKAEGEQVVPVSEEALAGLRALVRARAEAAGVAPAGSATGGALVVATGAAVRRRASSSARQRWAATRKLSFAATGAFNRPQLGPALVPPGP